MRYADLSHADLSGADFTGAGMFRTKLHRARRESASIPLLAGWLGDDEALAEKEDFRPKHGRTREEEDASR
ncbi:pentapeptide repeat-containing protein [Sorangium sp. So ce385]|uniref:pentapeptide repeat-containing protein n=1 Tax=Sorangium sp. So ce385 TaxID=3133308 RepID=UPI003F5C6AA4